MLPICAKRGKAKGDSAEEIDSQRARVEDAFSVTSAMYSIYSGFQHRGRGDVTGGVGGGRQEITLRIATNTQRSTQSTGPALASIVPAINILRRPVGQGARQQICTRGLCNKRGLNAVARDVRGGGGGHDTTLD